MGNYSKEELNEALKTVCSIISRCEKAQLKFTEGTSQHSLLKNRIKAMYISKLRIEYEILKLEVISTNQTNDSFEKSDKNALANYTNEELTKSLKPISSIISKCEKAQSKYPEGTSQYNRYKNMITAMYISKELIENEISDREIN